MQLWVISLRLLQFEVFVVIECQQLESFLMSPGIVSDRVLSPLFAMWLRTASTTTLTPYL